MPAEERQLSTIMTDLASVSVDSAEFLVKDKVSGAVGKVDGHEVAKSVDVGVSFLDTVDFDGYTATFNFNTVFDIDACKFALSVVAANASVTPNVTKIAFYGSSWTLLSEKTLNNVLEFESAIPANTARIQVFASNASTCTLEFLSGMQKGIRLVEEESELILKDVGFSLHSMVNFSGNTATFEISDTSSDFNNVEICLDVVAANASVTPNVSKFACYDKSWVALYEQITYGATSFVAKIPRGTKRIQVFATNASTCTIRANSSVKRSIYDGMKNVLIPTVIHRESYVNSNGAIRSDVNFYCVEINVKELKKFEAYIGTGGGKAVFIDTDNNVVGNAFSTGGSDAYVNKWYFFDVPSGAVKWIASQADPSKRPESSDIIVRSEYTNVLIDSYRITHPLWKKRVCFIGDSITDNGRYVNAFGDISGCIKIKRGSSGSTIAKTTGKDRNDSFVERFDNGVGDAWNQYPVDADLFIVLGGINDWGSDWLHVPFGDVDAAVDKSTFCGALKYLAKGLKERYKGRPIVFASMLHTGFITSTSLADWNEISNTSDNDALIFRQNWTNHTLQDYHDAIERVCALYGIKFVDMFNCGISALLESDGAEFYSDGLHPNESGAKIMANYLYSEILRSFVF